MSSNGSTIHTIIGGNSYGAICSILTLDKLLSGQLSTDKVIFYLDENVNYSSLKPDITSLFRRKSINLSFETKIIPNFNQLAIGEAQIDLDLCGGDIIDIRSGSNIHGALVLNELQKNIIFHNPITICMASARNDRVHVIKYGINGNERHSNSLPVDGSGDLEFFLKSIVKDNCKVQKKEVSVTYIKGKTTNVLNNYIKEEGKNPENSIKIMNEYLNIRGVTGDANDNHGFIYEEFMHLIILKFAKKIEESFSDFEMWTNVKINNINLDGGREEDVLCRIGSTIILMSQKHIVSSNEKANERILDEELSRMSGIFSNAGVYDLKKFVVTPNPRPDGEGSPRVREIKLGDVPKELQKIVNKLLEK
jgi:hypothetical protein